MSTVVRGVMEVLQQGLSLLSELDAQGYARVAPKPYNASIGQHYRHVLDHFLCLESGVRSGEIDYDDRARDPRLETDPAFARDITERLMAAFHNYPDDLLEKSCTVRYSVGYQDDGPMRMPSVVSRELAFCIGHAVHHYAILRLLCDTLGVDVLPEFGIAPSTLKHRTELLAS